MFAINIENLKTLKYHTFLLFTAWRYNVYSKCGHEYEKTFKEEESIEILNIFGLITNIEQCHKLYNHV